MNTNSIKVSIITPTFNDEMFIAKTILSVLGQSHSNFEMIIVDDCSKDKTVDIIKTFKDPRIKLFENDNNCGAAFSRNKAIKKATGDYIAFLDGDDLWNEDKLKKQLSFMLENGYDFTYTKYELIDEKDDKIGIVYTGPKKVTHSMFLHIDYIGTSTVIYKRSIYPDLCIPNDIFKRNDDAMWLLLSTKTNCFLFSETLSMYRKSSKSISSGSKTKLFKYHIILYQKLYGFSYMKSFVFALRNGLFYFYKQIFYRKKKAKEK